MFGGNIKEYSASWDKHVTKELFDHVFRFYSQVDFSFLVDKVERELDRGNAGGPQVRSRFPKSISSAHLAAASVHGLKILLTIKTFENVFPFSEKTRITDDSMLTDLAWHSFMLKPHKYYLITNTIMSLLYKFIHRKFYFNLAKEIQKAVETINREMVIPMVVDDEPKSFRRSSRGSAPVLVRHGTDKEIKIDVDIRDFIKKIVNDNYIDTNMDGVEWNMPLPLFVKFPYQTPSRSRSRTRRTRRTRRTTI